MLSIRITVRRVSSVRYGKGEEDHKIYRTHTHTLKCCFAYLNKSGCISIFTRNTKFGLATPSTWRHGQPSSSLTLKACP